MKRIFAFILVLCLIFCMAACSKPDEDSDTTTTGAATEERNTQYDDLVNEAINVLEAEWKAEYSEEIDNLERDGHFEIKNTRVIEIKENDIEDFKDIDYVIEFVLFTDYYGSAPYYTASKSQNDSVAVYSDGSMRVCDTNPFYRYTQWNYTTDYSDIIEKLTDCGSAYNCVKKLTQTA